MKRKTGIPKVRVDEGSYECPECEGVNYLDIYDYTHLIHRGSSLINCPMCKTKLILYCYESDNNSEL